jgi:membrane-bound ClpP family serine protease
MVMTAGVEILTDEGMQSQMARTPESFRTLNGARAVHWPRIFALLVIGMGIAGAQAAVEQPAAGGPAAGDNKVGAAANDLGEGRLIRVRLPITGRDDERAISVIQRVVDELKRLPRGDGRRPTLVFELSPQRGSGGSGEGTDFTRALKLASYLTRPEMSDVKTVAYIPRTIKGHAVLVALACEQLVMAPDAELGDATIDEDSSRAIDPKTVSAYRDIVAGKKRTVPLAIALGMVDRSLEVLKVETDQGIEFALRDELEELKKRHTIISQSTIVQPGSLGGFSGREGRDFGVLLASDADELARVLGLPPEAMKQDQSMLGDWRPVMVYIDGPLTRRKTHQLETVIGTELDHHKVNWVGITIDSEGGPLEDCRRLAESLAALDPNEVTTVAYVPVNASGGAAVVALACDQLVMQPQAQVGGAGTLPLDRSMLDAAREPFKAIAKKGNHSWSMLAALIDPDIDLFTYQNTKTGEVCYFSDEEARAQPDADNWRRGARVKSAGEALRLTSKRAQELGVATHIVDNFDELKKVYGITDEIHVAKPNWALELIEALSSPALAILLLVIGFVGVYVELHSPGVGVGGFVGAVAFLLFFWSQFLNGTAEWLEVLLFLGGIFCLLLELLVLPGFGVFGLGGAAMILVSLVLATQTFVLPRTESQLAELRHSLTIVAASTLLVVAASIALRRYLPNAPVFRKLLLNPPPEEELIDLDYRESLADYSHLVGEQGMATTNLMPAGKAEFGGQLVDVIAEGLPIDRGAAIVVIKTRGNRVVVRAVET